MQHDHAAGGGVAPYALTRVPPAIKGMFNTILQQSVFIRGVNGAASFFYIPIHIVFLSCCLTNPSTLLHKSLYRSFLTKSLSSAGPKA